MRLGLRQRIEVAKAEHARWKGRYGELGTELTKFILIIIGAVGYVISEKINPQWGEGVGEMVVFALFALGVLCLVAGLLLSFMFQQRLILILGRTEEIIQEAVSNPRATEGLIKQQMGEQIRYVGQCIKNMYARSFQLLCAGTGLCLMTLLFAQCVKGKKNDGYDVKINGPVHVSMEPVTLKS